MSPTQEDSTHNPAPGALLSELSALMNAHRHAFGQERAFRRAWRALQAPGAKHKVRQALQLKIISLTGYSMKERGKTDEVGGSNRYGLRQAAKSMMRWRFWIAKPSANSEIACGGCGSIAANAAVS